ncbi:MAG TPA: hypothetical protein VMZ28_06560 [Kofleriaceae bacterium]|nr:hypothetical protein [Kofleriaceae bacterium]
MRQMVVVVAIAIAVATPAAAGQSRGASGRTARPARTKAAKRLARPPRARVAKKASQRDVYGTGKTLREKFGSVYLAGFESASHINRHGVRINELKATQHDRLARQDYARLRKLGIRSARESINWDRVDLGGGSYDFSQFDRFIAAGKEHGMTQIWDLFHYGYPDDVDLFSQDFVTRYADYCTAVARHLRPQLAPGQIPFFTPVNEISWFAYAGGDIQDMAPHQTGKGAAVKRQLIKAWIAGAEAIWKELPEAQMVAAEPLVHRAPKPGASPEDVARIDHFNKKVVREAYDMLSGRVAPELGGSPRHLGIIGANYYPHMNQSEDGGGFLDRNDPRRVPFEDLLVDLHDAYPDHQIMVSEVMEDGKGRDGLAQELTRVKKTLAKRGVDDIVFTLYPIMRLHDWNQPSKWYPGGVWDHFKDSSRTVAGQPRRKRVKYRPLYDALKESIREIDPENATD